MKLSRKTLILSAYYGFLLLCLLGGAEWILRKYVYNITYPTMKDGSTTYPFQTTEFNTTATLNSFKMRDRELPAKAKGEFRILAVGDSFTFGLGVNEPESYPRVLERKLREGTRKNVVVMNGGGRAWAKDGFEFLSANGSRLAPDRIIYQVYIENDFYDALPYVLGKRQATPAAIGENQARLQHDSLHSTKDYFRSRVRLFDFLWSQLVRLDWVNDYLVRFNFRAGARNILLRELPALEQELVATEVEFLDKIKQESDRLKAPLTILLVPFKLQLFHRELFTNSRYDYKKPNQILRGFCESRKVTCLDLIESYERLDPKTVKSYYYSRDLHWTKLGHEQAASELYTLMAKELP